MRRVLVLLATGVLLAAGAVQARPPRAALPLPHVWHWDADEPEAPQPMEQEASWDEPEEANPFFYPGDYDPQYGSEGQIADADSFAARYGCRPIWNGALNHYVDACN